PPFLGERRLLSSEQPGPWAAGSKAFPMPSWFVPRTSCALCRRLSADSASRQRSRTMIARSLSLRFLLIACLAVNSLILAGWALVDQVWFAYPFQSRGTSLLATGFLTSFLLTVLLVVQLVRRRAALAADTETKFRSLLESAPDPIVIMNGEGRVTL